MLQVNDVTDNPLATVPEFRAFQENVKNWITAPPVAEQLTVIGSYNLF
jgi:hypothetical protein